MAKLLDVMGFGGGGKGGGGGSAPEDQPDSATSKSIVKVLDLLSEGPIKGLVTGDARSIYLDGTPVQAENGDFNFPGVGWEIRHGTQDQSHIPGFPNVENEVSLRQELRGDNPYTREFTNPDLSFVRIRMQLPALQRVTDDGIKGYRIDYQLELASDGGPFEVYRGGAFDDKSSGVYERDETIRLPAGKAPWRVRVRRLTPNADDSKISDLVYIVAVVEGIDAKLRYPNSAVMGLQASADQFSSIPSRGYLVDGLICRVPTNYNPDTREYTGIWDGTFKQAYTNNPVWVMYTITGHPRFGLRDRINYSNFNIWSLYEVARFCDELVPDGKGGQEPRYTVNTYIQSRQQGYEFLANMASVFKGMAYMTAGNIGISADMPRAPGSRVYTNSDVENGEFTYAGAEAGTRYTSAAVGWNNPASLYAKEVAYEEADAATIAQLGLVQTEFDAFACTSEGQARRSARWALLTSQYETDVVTFKASLNALRDRVGDVIQIQDTNRSRVPDTEGRIASATASEIVLDRAVAPGMVGSDLIVSMPSGYSESSKIVSVSGRTVTVEPAYTGVPQVQGVWAIDGEVRPALYRIRSIDDEGDARFKVTAYAYADGKHGNIESGIRIEERPTINPDALQVAPKNLRITGGWVINQGVSVPNVTFAWDQTKNADSYEGAWRVDSGEWIRFARQGNTELTIDNIRTGNYQFWVRAIGPTDAKSKMVYSDLVEVKSKDMPPPVVATLTTEGQIMAIKVNIGYSTVPDNTEYAELWSSPTSVFSDATYLTQIPYPGTTYTLQNLAHDKKVWFWVRLVDKNKLAGDFYPATTAPGVLGQTEGDSDTLLTWLDGQIGKEQLTQELLGPIESIVDIQAEMDGVQQAIAGLTTANQNLDQALQDTNDRVDALQQKVDDLSLGEQYDPAKEYLAGTVVFDNGKMYQALQDVPAGTPTSNTSYWEYVGDYASLEAAISAVSLGLSTLEVRVTDVDGKVDANTSQIEVLQSKVDDPNTGLSALAQGMQQLQTQVTTLDGTVTTMVSNLTALTARVDATEQGLSAQGSAIQDLNTTVTQHGNDISSNSNSITQLTASVGSAQQSADAAQQAAQAAMTAAGEKGEVIYGTSTPGTAKRLPQNLWIDTTGGKNTPKRWNGSAWVAVTDKVAKDAAAAAAAAQQTANEAKTIAEGAATAVQSLTSTVQQQDGRITSNAQNLTALEATVTNLNSSASNLLVDSNDPLVRSGNVYLFGTYKLSENLVPNEDYTLVVNYTHTPVSGDSDSAIGVWAGGSSQKVGELEKGKVGQTQVVRFKKSTANQIPRDIRFYYVPSPGTQGGGATIHWATLYLGGTIPVLRWQPNLNETAGGVVANAQAVDRLTIEVDDVKATASNVWSINAQMRDLDEVATDAAAAAADAMAAANAANQLAQSASATAQMALNATVDINGKIEASWQVKLEAGYQGNMVVAGVQLGISNEGGQVQSNFTVVANRFAIVDNISGQPKAVFVLQNGQAILNDAIIGNASISFAKITNDIQSDNYVQNTSGWLLDKNGNFYNNGSNGNGRRVSTSTLDIIYYPNGNTAILFGIW